MKSKLLSKITVLLTSVFLFFSLAVPVPAFASYAGASFGEGGKLTFNYNQDDYSSETDLRTSSGTKITANSPEVQKGITMARNIVIFFEAAAIIGLVIYFIISCVKIAAAGDNAKERQEAVTQTLHVLIALGIVGSISAIIGIAFSLLT